MKIAIILHKKVHILCNTSYELNKSVSKTVKIWTEIVIQTPFLFKFWLYKQMHHWTVFVSYFIEYSNYKQSAITYFPMQHIYTIYWKRFSFLIGTTRIFAMTRKNFCRIIGNCCQQKTFIHHFFGNGASVPGTIACTCV